jgi:hypothetical protein
LAPIVLEVNELFEANLQRSSVDFVPFESTRNDKEKKKNRAKKRNILGERAVCQGSAFDWPPSLTLI